MNSDVSSPSDSKKRRIMIITADESIIEQIQNSNNGSLFKSIILDTDGNNIQLGNNQTTNDTKKVKHASLTCVVCGSTANGYNFDAISCESCKAFFRRNALKDPETLFCRRNKDCDITLESRRRCSACRLTKCLNSGMKRDRLLTAEQKAAKRRTIEENRHLTLQINNNNNDIDNETKFQLLSPTNSDFPPTPKSTNILLLKDFTDLLPQTSSSSTVLSSEELQRVETIQLSFEQRIELAARDGLPWNPSFYSTTLLQHINARSVSVMRLLSFFKQIPEFNELNVDDKVTLVKYNLMPLVILNSTLSYQMGNETLIEADSDAPWSPSMFINVHGQEVYQQLKKIFDSFVLIAQYDPRIIQLALVILILTKGFSTSLSSAEPILNDGLAVYRAQNYYTELLWKYIEAQHGYGKALHIFNDLVVHFISWQMLERNIHHTVQNALSPTEINELLPIMKSLLHIP